MPIEVRSLAEWEAAGIPGMLSVVIPAHNEEGHIAETVRELTAALQAAEIHYEILVVNDNSSLKKQVRQLTNDNTDLKNKLAAARDNARFTDKRIAALEAEYASAILR